MTKLELVSYLVGLQSIMEGKEDAGIPKGQTLGREYTRHYTQLTDIIKKEEEEGNDRQRQA